MKTRLLAFLAALLLCLGQALAAEPAKPYRLTILHTNDVHARIAEFNKLGQICTQEESAKGECFGGYPRIAAAVEAERKKGGNVILLDAGDQFQGTIFYTVLKGRPSQGVMNALHYQAMTLGNHEFDDGPTILEQTFLNGLSTTVLAANLDASREPGLKGRIKPWAVFTVGGRKVGVVGLANEDTTHLSSPGPDLTFKQAEAPLRDAVKELKAQHADIIIALTHVGLDRDKQLAAEVDGIDVIVGGHSHTLLSNTDPAASGPYPVVVNSPSGRPVLVVQAEAWGKYLGMLTVEFDAKGAPASWNGGPLLLDASRPQDQAMAAKVNTWQEELKPFMSQVLGQVGDTLQPDCRSGECGLGDIMADAVRLSARNQGVQAAFINGGAIRAGLKAGDVTLGDLLTFYPFTDNVATFQLTGRDLLAVLEHGVSTADKPTGTGTGRFLQVSGMRYSFDPRRPEGQRIITADIASPDGDFAPVQPDKLYTLATSGYVFKGGDGYAMLKEKAKRVYAFGTSVSDALMDHFKGNSPLAPRLEGRIVRLGDALPK